ncbi:hypothetical protein TCAL_16759 [Tigriopus californicus]|uniref:Uncharacterized protein n=1 Tax=Tigriopus californicus TaxID=6832 RepID=A0A553PTV0_TIGCA|nr:hypothetical protein TCAL_16759 [Tigriopus californicus]
MEPSRYQGNGNEPGNDVLHFTSEDIKRFLRLSLRSPQWVTFKAVAVLAHCGQLKCSQLQFIKWGDMELSEMGLRIKHPLRADGSTFMVPFDDHDVLGCQASKLRKYVVACRACRPNNEDDSPLIRAFSHKIHMKSEMSITELRDIPRRIAEVLELSNPERYLDRAFVNSKDVHLSEDSDDDQDDQNLDISNKEYHRRAWKEWQRFAKFFGCKKTQSEEDYATYFRHLKETQGDSVNSILRKYSLLNLMHKRKFQSSLMDWPNLKTAILSWKAMDEAKKNKKVKQLTRDNVLTFLDMDVLQDPEMVLIKAAMALLFYSKVNVGTISRAQSNQIQRLSSGGYKVQVTRPAKYRLREDVSFPIPPGPVSRALDQYLTLLEANLGQPIQGQFLKHDMDSSANLQQARLWKFPTIVAKRLGLSEPDQYHGGRSFYMEQRNGPSTNGAAIAMEIRNLQQKLDLTAFPIADVEDIGSKNGSRAKSEYKIQWQSFIAFCQSNAPQEDDYIR